MSLTARRPNQYYAFLASPGDVGEERQHVRKYFERYNRHHARLWNVRFEVVDWENYATIGVGRPQELITQQTLEKFKESLALVVGIMGQRFGSPTGEAESGTEEEFNWALESHLASGWPEIKWFFRRIEQFVAPADPQKIVQAAEQWNQVIAFRNRLQTNDPPVYYAEYPNPAEFREVLENDLSAWLSDSGRPWVPTLAASGADRTVSADGNVTGSVIITGDGNTVVVAPPRPAGFDLATYREALIERYDVLNFEMLDVSGAYYGGVKLWSVFVPQSVRECHEYTPHLLEMPKEQVQRLVQKDELDAEEMAEVAKLVEERRRQYFSQPLRPVLDVIDDPSMKRCVVLGDPGSGKSALLRFLALRWTQIKDERQRDVVPLPLLIELRDYHRWECPAEKDFVRFLHEAPTWYRLNRETLDYSLHQPGRIVMLLDGLDEIFVSAEREHVINDIHRFGHEYPDVRIVVTSRVVGYRSQRLRDAEFRHFMLQDLDADQIDVFLGFWHGVTIENEEETQTKRERLRKAIKQSKSIAMLAGNPLLLTMMAILNLHQELPRDHTELYQQCARLLLYQWDFERTLKDFPGLSDEIGLREKTDILRAVAYAMKTRPSDKSGSNFIDGQTLSSLIRDYLHDELNFDQARAVARALVEQLRTRNFILCYLGADSYAFVHSTFLEYFCAAEIVHQFNVTKTLNEQDLIALFDAHCRDDDWRELLRLICGQIDDQFVGHIVKHLATRTDLEKWDRNTSMPELLLAICCLGEMRSLTKHGTIADSLMMKAATYLLEAYAFHDEYLGDLVFKLIPNSALKASTIEVVNASREVARRRTTDSNVVHSSLPKLRDSRNRQVDEMTHFLSHWGRFMVNMVNDRNDSVDFALRVDSDGARAGALQALAENWPDENTRKLLEERAVQDENDEPRSASLQVLAKKWPDKNTRELLAQQAVQDEHEDPRHAALQALAENWPDENTLELVESQVKSFKKGWHRDEIQKVAKSLRQKLSARGEAKN